MNGIDWAASAMTAAQSRLDIATENLANLSTDGYHRWDARGFLTARGAEIVPTREQRHGARNDVDPIGEMIDIVTAQRAFEGAQKVVEAIDGTRKQSNDAGRLK